LENRQLEKMLCYFLADDHLDRLSGNFFEYLTLENVLKNEEFRNKYGVPENIKRGVKDISDFALEMGEGKLVLLEVKSEELSYFSKEISGEKLEDKIKRIKNRNFQTPYYYVVANMHTAESNQINLVTKYEDLD
jgi:hypothetical protein